MNIVFFGTGGAGSAPHRVKMCIGVETYDTTILLDVGEGCSRSMNILGYSLKDFDYIYISHLHPDHYAGLFDLVVDSIDIQRLRILVPTHIAEEARSRIMDMIPRSVHGRTEIIFVENSIRLGRRTFIRIVGVKHTVPCYGVLVDDGVHRLFYSSDTQFIPETIASLGHLDMLIHEATMPSGMYGEAIATGHTTVDQILAYAYASRFSVAIVHLTKASEKDLVEKLRRGRFRNIVVPNDGTILTL